MHKIEQFQDKIARLYPPTEEEKENNRRVLSKPITFCVTNACQLRCTYCYETHKGNSYMNFDTAKKFMDMILSGEKGMSQYITVQNSPAVTLEFIGGEPFMAIDLIYKICDYWFEKTTELMHPWADKTCISICSNGVAYNDSKVQKFLNDYKNVLSFSVTIDGNKKLHDTCRLFKDSHKGSYDIAYAAAKDWMDKGNFMGSKITISQQNLPFTYEAIVHMIDMGYDEINANCVYEAEWTNSDASIFYKEGKKIADEFLKRDLNFENDFYCSLFSEDFFKPKNENDLTCWCGGTGDMLACDWDGQIYPCIRYMQMSLGDDQPPLPIGNVDDGVMILPEHKQNVINLWSVDRRTQSTDECFYCPIAEGCSYCSAWNYQLYGTANSRCTRICPMHKSRALFNVYFWNKYYIKNNIKKRMKLYVPKEWALEIVDEQEFNNLLDLSMREV